MRAVGAARGVAILAAGALMVPLATVAQAAPLLASIAPQGRPTGLGGGDGAVASARGGGAAVILSVSPRPLARTGTPLAARDMVLKVADTADQGFARWITAFRHRAEARGISRRTLDAAFAGAQLDTNALRHDANQSEFTKTLWDYLDSAASDSRVAGGRAALRRYSALLDRIEARYGVDRQYVVAIWGLESAYGTHRGGSHIIASLATLAYEGRRGRFFENELMAALRILDHGDVRSADMTGSWAGAMGHTQFMPTSYLAYAVDFNGDGRRDIWSDDPTDALASTAAYLARHGWVRGQPWGVEVNLPRGFDYAQADRRITKSPANWARLGVVGLNGRAVPNYGAGSILVPAGAHGAAFMIFHNFDVIERYNTADAYIIGVGHLADRIMGGGPIHHAWPRGDRALSFAERVELQRRLTAAGYGTRADGLIGPLTIDAVRGYQRAHRLIPDGYASLTLLRRLRG